MLKKILIGAAAVLSIAGATAATTSAADAAPYGFGGYHGGYGYRGYGYRGYGGAGLLGAGLLGLAVGATLAHPYYGPPPVAYVGPGYYGYYGGCRTYFRWDPYYARYVRVDRCY